MLSAGREPLLIEQHYRPDVLRTASIGRRAGAYAIDHVLLTVTFGIGWLIWFAIVAPRGQTPGKQVLSLYIMRDDGTRAGGGYTWLREYLVKQLLVLGLMQLALLTMAWLTGIYDFPVRVYPLSYLPERSAVLLGFGAPLIVGILLALDPKRQALWDKIVRTQVAHAPLGHRPRTADELWREQQRAWHASQHAAASAGDPPSPPAKTVGDELRELKTLQDEGILTPEEYEEHRRRLVERL